MKPVKLVGVGLLAAAALAPGEAAAHSYDSDDSSHPFRLIAYPFHFLGKGIEYGALRPIHHCVSQPKKRYLWGHVSHPHTENYWGDYDQYQRSSY